MLVKAEQKYIRQSPRKLNLIAGAIRHLSLDEALTQLQAQPKKAAQPILKTLNQAIANATNNAGLKRETLKINRLEVLAGSTYKRWRAVARGLAHPILKRTSHIKIILEGEK